MKYLTYIIILVAALGCNSISNSPERVKLAKVFDKYLYLDNLEYLVPEGLSADDSATIVSDYIEKWVFEQLLLHEAELYLSEAEKNVEQQIEDYKRSLLIFKYEQSYIQKKIDPNIAEEEILNYYEEYSQNFVLNNPIVKCLYIKLPIDAPDKNKVKRWYRSSKQDDLNELEKYCYENAVKYEVIDNEWVDFTEITKHLPPIPYSTESFLKYRKYIDLKDEEFHYYLRVYDHHLAGEEAPLDHVHEKIESILLNKRKIKLIDKLESDIYNNALDRGHFNIY